MHISAEDARRKVWWNRDLWTHLEVVDSWLRLTSEPPGYGWLLNYSWLLSHPVTDILVELPFAVAFLGLVRRHVAGPQFQRVSQQVLSVQID